jgi:glycine oxidase
VQAEARAPGVHRDSPDLVVVGAGVMGLAMAVTAARAGLAVVVHEAAGDLCAGAGWRSGGMIAPDCEADGAHPEVVEAGRRSLALWPGLADGVTLTGTLVVAAPRDGATLDRFALLATNHRRVDAVGLAALEPALAGRFAAGLHFPAEGHLDPRRVLPELSDRLAAMGGAVRFSSPVEPEDVPAGAVVDARGLGARARLPGLRGVKGEMALLRSRDVDLVRPVRLLHHRHPLYVVPRAGGVFMVGATTIETDVDPVVTLRSAGELLTQAYALHPAFAEAEVLEFAAGLRPAFADHAPRLARAGRIVTVNGLYRHGWLLAPALAERALGLVRAILDAEPEETDADRRQRA